MSNKNYRDELLIAADQKIKEKEYWHEKLAGELVKSAFPYDSRNVTGQSNIEIIKFTFAGELFSGLMKLGSHSDYTLHIILLANLSILLSKYSYHSDSGGKDIILGTPIYKQDIQGEFVNTVLAVRNQIDDSITYKELLLQVKQTVLEALENYSYPIEVLVEELGLPLTDSDFPLFDVTLMLENIHEKKYIMHIPTNMVFSFLRNRDSIEARVEYNPLRFFNTTVKRIVDQLIRLTSQVIFNIETKLGDIDILAETERKRLLEEFNNTTADFPSYFLLHQWFERQAVQNFNKAALTWSGDETYDVIRHMSYKDLNEKANQLAHELRLRGVKRGSIVGIIMKSQPELVIGILAILKAGGAYLPINHEYPQERIASILDDSGVSMVLTQSVILDKLSYTAIQGLKHARVEPHKTGVRPQSDFDSIPHPDRSLINGEKYGHYIGHAMVRHAISIQGTRGCPYMCAFCHRTMEKRNVARSAENIFEEVKYYYDKGVRRFSFVDEIFNLDAPNSMRFFRSVLKNKMKLQLFFPNGMRADRLYRDYIDLMVEAGTVNVGLALETASPRLQELIRKNLDIEKLRENAEYFCSKYPHVILELFTMHGFPTETEDEALSTLNFIKSLKWVHFPYVFLLKIHPSTDMFKLALKSGISMEAIERSMTAAFHEMPETLPFPKSFTRQYVARFLNEYFLSRERLLHLLPYQMKIASEKELVAKYDNYLPAKIKTFNDIIENVGISREELGGARLIRDDSPYKPDYSALKISRYQVKKPKEDALRVLLLDLSVLFSHEKKDILHGEVTEPLGLLYLLTYLRETFKDRINGKIAKAKIDFDNFEELKILVCDFKPHLIGIRTLSYFKDFFHKTIALIKEWGITAPIITGGPYGTSDYKLVLQDPKVELTVLKEGEITLGQLVEKMMANHNKLPGEDVLESIKGIAFTRKEDKSQLKNHTRELLCLDKSAAKLSRHPTGNLENVNRPEDLLYLISTSGTTGVPKSVMIEHRNLANLIRFQFSKTNIDFNKVLQFASIGFDVSAQEIFSTLLWGGELVLIDKEVKNNLPLLFKVLRKNQVTTLFLPPAFLKYVFSDPGYAGQFPGFVKHIVAAGEQLFVTRPIEKYLKENRVYLHNHYGPSETHVVTALTLDPTHSIPGRPSIGKPISNTRVYILDEKKNLMPGGAVGELCIAGANLGRGYYKSQMLTESKFIDNPFEKGQRLYLTGDLARWLPDGNIEFLGRIDHQVKIRGFRIELGEIRNHLAKYPGIKETVVIDKEINGEKCLCAYVVSHKEIDISEIRDKLSDTLPEYMVPLYFLQLEKLPLNPNGKIDRKALPEPELKPRDKYTAPRDEIEKRLVRIWAELLQLEEKVIGIDADFFAVGGHSLRATRLTNKIHQAFRVEIPLKEIFKQPTIKELSKYIKKAVKVSYVSIEPVEKKEYYLLSSAQKRLYIVHQMEMDNISYNLPAIAELEGKLGIERFKEGIRKLIDRHESLRTSFHMIDNHLVQRVHDEVEFEIEYDDSGNRQEAISNKEEILLEPIIKNFIRPFDLAQAPLLRVKLIKTGEQEHMLMIDMHHIVMDGISLGIFIKEFMMIYGREKLSVLKNSYKEFLAWQNREKKAQSIKKQEEYWKKQFEGEIPVLNLPIDYNRPLVSSSAGKQVSFRLGSSETNRLKYLAVKARTSLFMVLLSVFNILLFKITGQEDIVVGTPVAGRRHAELQQIIGMFVNTLALRNYPSGDKSYREFLREIKKRTMAAFENQDYPFEDLVEQVETNRDTGRNPVFSVMLAMQDMDLPEPKIPGLKLQTLHHDPGGSRFDMTLFAREDRDEFSFSLEYGTKLFKKETIIRYIEYFKRIVSLATGNLDAMLGEIEVIEEEEKRQLIVDFNNTGALYPKEKPLYELFEEQVEKTSDNTAVVFEDKKLTYRVLNQKANQLTRVLRAKNISPDKVVGIMVHPSVEMIVGILSILKAGGSYLPIDPEYPGKRKKYMLKDSKTELVLTSLKALPGISHESDLGSLKDICEIIDLSNGYLYNGYRTNSEGVNSCMDLAYVIYTSGSTGIPKGVTISHQNVVNFIEGITSRIPFESGKSILTLTTISFDIFVLETLLPLTKGLKMIIATQQQRLDLELLKNIVKKNQMDMIQSTPSRLQLMMEDFHWLKGVKVLMVGGEAFPNKLLEGLQKEFGGKIYNLYGPTETTIWSALKDLTRAGGITIGSPIANTYIYILNMYVGFQPVGVAGELCIGGDGAARGYLNKPELTSEKFVELEVKVEAEEGEAPQEQIPNPMIQIPNKPMSYIYKTGDLARWLPDGEIQFLGRIDHQVKIRGFRIELEEIENHLLQLEPVKEVVVSDKEINGNKYLCAFMVSDNEIEIPEMRNKLSKVLPTYMIPSYFVQLKKLPLTPNSKIDRKALPDPELKGEDRYIPPRDEMEKRMVKIWAELLNLEENVIGINTSFFSLGGHSLKATILSNQIKRVFQVEIALTGFFKQPTVRELIKYIKRAMKVCFISIETVEKKEYYGLSSAQKRLYILQQTQPDSTAYNISGIFALEGEVGERELERIFREMLKRHESLRTSFEIVDDEPVQRIHDPMEFKIEYYNIRKGLAPLAIEPSARSRQLKASTIKEFIRPFDLSQAPLFRVGLIISEELTSILLFDLHHIITDGTSQEILTKEFMALAAGDKLPPLRLRYKDYAAWQNSNEQQELVKQQESFWVELYSPSHELPVLNLPLDYPRHIMQSFEGASVSFVLDENKTKQLKTMANQSQVTLYMAILALFNLFLAKLSGQEDIIVGTPLAARRHADLEHIVGMLVNTLPMRNYPSGGKAFTQFLKEVKQHTLQAYENQEYQFENLVEKISVGRDTSRNPVFDVMFNLFYPSEYKGDIPGMTEKKESEYSYENIIDTSKFDLNLLAIDFGETVHFDLEYCTKLFKISTIERFIGYFQNILTSLFLPGGNREQKISHIEIITGNEKEEILKLSHGVKEWLEPDLSIHRWFEETVKEHPAETALVFADKNLSYKELNCKANQLARILREKGVNRDTIVGVMVERSFEMVIAILGVMKTGAAYLPIDSQYPAQRKCYMLEDSGVKFLLTNFQLRSNADYIPSTIEILGIGTEKIYKGNSSNLPHITTGSHLVYVIYTSGSTGRPKGVMLEHRNVVNLIKHDYEYTNIDFSCILQFHSIGFDASFHEIFGALLTGGRLVLMQKEMQSNIYEFLKMVGKSKIKTLFLPMSFLKTIFGEDEYVSRIPRCVNHIQTAGDPVIINDRFREYLRTNHVYLHNHYGPSEAHVVTALTVEPWGDIPGLPSIGRPLMNTGIYILDRDNHLLPVGVPGELCIGGVQVGRGYLGRCELTREKFRRTVISHRSLVIENFERAVNDRSGKFFPNDRLYSTGDLARWIADGNIEFLGRLDMQVKIRGFRIEPGEIEQRLLNHESIKEAVVLAKDDDSGDKYLCTYIVADSKFASSLSLSPAVLREYLSTFLPEYMIPSYFIQLDHIPLTPNGKVDRKALPVPGIQAGENYLPPRDEIEWKLVKIWSGILGIEKKNIGIDDNFFQIGGHSLKAILLISRVQKELDVNVPLSRIFKTPHIRELANYIKGAVQEKYVSIEPVEKKKYYPLSSAQKRLYILRQMDKTATNYNIPIVVSLVGELDRKQLQKTFQKLLLRHESLRTSFQMMDDTPVQRIHDQVEFVIEYCDTGNRQEAIGNSGGAEPFIKNFIRPFDLAQAPLLRVGLIHLGEYKHLLMVDMHHIISDGTSIGILIKDFMALYANRELEPLRIRYGDYSPWQTKRREQESLRAQEKFWMKEFEGEIPVLNINTDYTRLVLRGFKGKSVNFEISTGVSGALCLLAQEEGVTLFMVLLAIINIFLYKLSGQEDIVVGIPIEGRNHESLRQLVGMFVNTLALRNYPVRNKTFLEFLFQLKEKNLAAFENQEYPFDQLVEKVEITRDTSRNPLFDVMFVFQNMETPAIEIPGLKLEPISFETGTSKFDMTFYVEEIEGFLQCHIEFSTDLFKSSTIDRFVDYFKHLVSRVIDHPEIEIGQIEIITGEEKRQLLVELNATNRVFPGAKTLMDLFAGQVERTPDHVALKGPILQKTNNIPGSVLRVDLNNNVENCSLTYDELNKKTNQWAGVLREKGVGPNGIVGLMVDRSIEMVIGLYGILKAGGAYMPVSPEYPPERIRYMLAESGSRWLVTQEKDLLSIRFTGEIINIEVPVVYQASQDLFTGNPVRYSSPEDLVYVIYTSGSTGKPKGVPIKNCGFVNLVYWYITEFDLHDRDRYLLIAPVSFDLAQKNLFAPLISGGCLCLVPPGIPDYDILSAFIGWEHQTVINCAPSVFYPFVEVNIADGFIKLGSLRYVFLGGEPIQVEQLAAWLDSEACHCEIVNTYGPTECTDVVSFYHPYRGTINGQKILPIGKPVYNVRLYILDKGRQLLPMGFPGELYIGGIGLSEGYLNNPEMTFEKFISSPFHNLNQLGQRLNDFGEALVEDTKNAEISPPLSIPSFHHQTLKTRPSILYKTGDLSRWLVEGNIEFLGRIDQQVKVRGLRIELGEIEAHLSKHERVKAVAVSVIADPKRGNYLCAYIVPPSPVTPAVALGLELKAYLSRFLPGYMVPNHIVVLEKLPLTSSGKVDKKALPVPEIRGEPKYAAPRDNQEAQLVKIWGEVLGTTTLDTSAAIGIDDNFFEQGGNSLKAALMISKIHREFDAPLSLMDIFTAPTIRQLADKIKVVDVDRFVPIESAELKEFYKLSPAQKRMFIVQQMNLENIGYNIPSVVRLEGVIERDKLSKAFESLIKRHESLRTSFQLMEEEPVQRVHEGVEFQIEYFYIEDREERNYTTPITNTITNFLRPFDLTCAPLLRVRLIRTRESQYVLLVDMHHIISDGASMGIFTREFMLLYGGEELPALPIRYTDYSQWQNSKTVREEITHQEQYWLKEFEDKVPVVNLPLDYPRPSMQSFAGSHIYFQLSSREFQALEKLAREAEATLYQVVLAVVQILAAKLSGEEDIVVGTPVEGRRHENLGHLIGMLVNLLALRSQPAGQKTFKYFLQDVKTSALAAFENQQYPFEELVEKVGNMINVVFVFQNTENPKLEISGLTIEPQTYESSTAKFDITITMTELTESLFFSIEYCTALFKKQTIERFIGYFKRIIASVLENPGIRISQIPIIAHEEKEQVLQEWNNTAAAYPADQTLHRLFEQQVERTPEHIAVIGEMQSAERRAQSIERNMERLAPYAMRCALTYRELNEKSDQLAHLLQEKGVEPDTIVAIMVERSLEMIIGILGILKAGGAYLPIDPGYPEKRVNFMLADISAKVLLASPGTKDKVIEWAEERFVEIIDISALSSLSTLTSTSTCQVSPTNLAYIIYTSGTTGKPKAVMIQHRNVVRLMVNERSSFDFTDNDVWTMFHSYCFDFSVWEMYGALLYGGKLVIIPKMIARDPEGFLKELKEKNVTILNQTPTAFYNLSSEELKHNTRDLNLRCVIFGGEALKPIKLSQWRRKYPGIKLINMFGITETTVHVTYKEITGKEIELNISNIGKPIPTLSTYIMDKNLELLPPGIPGELCVGGEGAARGYLNRVEFTAKKFLANPYKPKEIIYRSGDQAKFLDNGEMEYLGRLDQQVKIRGYRIELGEVEAQLLNHHDINDAVVLAKEDAAGGHLCAYVVAGGMDYAQDAGRGMGVEVDAASLREYLAQKLPGYMIPSYFVLLEQIPLTLSGKVDRNALPEPGIIVEKRYSAPGNHVEKKLAALWAEVLNVPGESIGINDNFFELGGHSLNAIILAVKIHNDLKVKIPLGQLFKIPSIRALAWYIQETGEDKSESVQAVEEAEYYPISTAQTGIFVQQQKLKEVVAYNMPQLMPLDFDVDKERLRQTFIMLINRHESLRSSFHLVDGKPVQRIHPGRDINLTVEYHEIAGTADATKQRLQLKHILRDLIRVFNLARAPLLRVGLIKLKDKKYLLEIDMHHIITDGVSMEILRKEFMALYNSEPLTPLKSRYKDYVVWQNIKEVRGTITKQKEFWLKTFAGEIPVLNLPFDFKRPGIKRFQGNRFDFIIEKGKTEQLKSLADQEGVTLYMVLLSCYFILLSKFGNQEDIVVGSPVTGRRQAELLNIVGMFVNMLAIKSGPSAHENFREYLQDLKLRVIDALENQDYHFEELVMQLGLQGDPGRNPLFEAVFAMNNTGTDQGTENPENNRYPVEFMASKFDLLLNAVELNGKIFLMLEYSTQLFKPSTLESMAKHYLEILDQVVEEPGIPLENIKMSYQLVEMNSDGLLEDQGDFGF